MHDGGKARRGQRSRQEIAVMDGEPNLLAGGRIESGMRGEEGARLVRWRIAKAIDIMMAVALRVGDADQGAKREILLHGKPCLAGQIFTRDKDLVARRA